MEESILDIKLTQRPPFGNSQGQKQTDGSRFDNWTEGRSGGTLRRHRVGVDQANRDFSRSQPLPQALRSSPPDWPPPCVNTDTKLPTLSHHGTVNMETLFGAPYDIRHAPPSHGQPPQVYSNYFARVKDLVQHASKKNENKPVILVGHSFGARAGLDFVNSTPLSWRKKFVKHMVLISPTPPTGFVQVITNLLSGPEVIVVPTVKRLGLRLMWRTFASSLTSLPSPLVFGYEPLVVTKHRNYSAYDYMDLLTVLGFSTDVVKRVLATKLKADAPMVPTTYLTGASIQTPNQVMFWDCNFDVVPEYVYGDGDKVVNLVSVLAFVKEISRQQRWGNIHFKFVKIVNVTHSTIVIQEHPLKRVMAEILEANHRRDNM
ncbi:lecithin-cholesterol acyltransferase-like 1 [Aegilops tauschii subsp. strangulata]|uniref:lecithin-cholesterol acyltransferase-like 1 n=1 Tax=Aegilops tauschii subsp. strangulata TaxID=200361 RepID=UPI003CC86A8C